MQVWGPEDLSHLLLAGMDVQNPGLEADQPEFQTLWQEVLMHQDSFNCGRKLLPQQQVFQNINMFISNSLVCLANAHFGLQVI